MPPWRSGWRCCGEPARTPTTWSRTRSSRRTPRCPGFRADGEFRGWLLTIVRNETRNLFRSRGRRAAREELAQLPEVDLAFDDPEAAALGAVRRGELLAGVRRLPADLREVVACRYLLELTEAETAAALGIPAGTVKSRLHRALTMLRQEVTDG